MPPFRLSGLHLILVSYENNMGWKLGRGQILPVDLKKMPVSKVHLNDERPTLNIERRTSNNDVAPLLNL